LKKLEIFAILLQPKVFIEQSGPILIRWTCANIWSNPVDTQKNSDQAFYCSDQCSLDIHIWSGWVFFEISSYPGPVLNCRIRFDCDPETGSCSILEEGWQTGRLCSDLTGAWLMLNCWRQSLEDLPLCWVVFWSVFTIC